MRARSRPSKVLMVQRRKQAGWCIVCSSQTKLISRVLTNNSNKIESGFTT
jgi:hypothetical protein